MNCRLIIRQVKCIRQKIKASPLGGNGEVGVVQVEDFKLLGVEALGERKETEAKESFLKSST